MSHWDQYLPGGTNDPYGQETAYETWRRDQRKTLARLQRQQDERELAEQMAQPDFEERMARIMAKVDGE